VGLKLEHARKTLERMDRAEQSIHLFGCGASGILLRLEDKHGLGGGLEDIFRFCEKVFYGPICFHKSLRSIGNWKMKI
jgi:hypothetical protein